MEEDSSTNLGLIHMCTHIHVGMCVGMCIHLGSQTTHLHIHREKKINRKMKIFVKHLRSINCNIEKKQKYLEINILYYTHVFKTSPHSHNCNQILELYNINPESTFYHN